MGGPRASTLRQIHAGKICCWCHNILPPRGNDAVGERLCLTCMERHLTPVVMTVRQQSGPVPSIGVALFDVGEERRPLWAGRYRHHEPLYRMVQSSFQPGEALRQLGNALRSRVNGDITLRLTRQQYDRLRKAQRR